MKRCTLYKSLPTARLVGTQRDEGSAWDAILSRFSCSCWLKAQHDVDGLMPVLSSGRSAFRCGQAEGYELTQADGL